MKIILLTAIWYASFVNKYTTFLLNAFDPFDSSPAAWHGFHKNLEDVDGGVGTEDLINYSDKVPKLPQSCKQYLYVH